MQVIVIHIDGAGCLWCSQCKLSATCSKHTSLSMTTALNCTTQRSSTQTTQHMNMYQQQTHPVRMVGVCGQPGMLQHSQIVWHLPLQLLLL